MANPIRSKLHQHASIGRKQIEAQAADLNALYIAARERLESRIYNYVREKRSSFTGPKLVLLMEELRKEYADFELKYTDKLKYALNYVVDGYYRDAMLAMGLTGNKTISGGINKERIKLMMDDAFSHVAGATRNMEDYTISSLRRISAQVMREASLTGESRASVARRLLTTNNRDGLFRFIDRAGRKWDNEAYFNMLSRTLLHNNAREAYLEGCADEGNDIVTVSSSGDPCKVCARWENRLLSISGRNSKLPSLQSAIDEGLFHPNCTHRIVAVPPEIAAEYYTPDGREKQQETQAETEVSSDYDRKRDGFYQDALNAGGSKEAAAALADLYTPELAEKCNPPKVKFQKFTGSNDGAYCLRDTIVLDKDVSSWNGCISTIRHEFGHYVDNMIRWQSPELQAKLAEAAQQDWQSMKAAYKGKLSSLKMNNLESFNQKILELYGKEYSLLSNEERHRVVQWFDTIGSISNGRYGGGHDSKYYSDCLPNVEAVANVHCAIRSGWTEFQKDFPNIWKCVEEMLK